MPVDFLGVREKIKEIGESAPQVAKRMAELRRRARQLLEEQAREAEALRKKVGLAAKADSYLRCALPKEGAMDAAFGTPPLPKGATILAADGSQINPDRHAPVNYYLINVGAIQLVLGSAAPPEESLQSELYFGEYEASGTVSENTVALTRDQKERAALAEIAKGAKQQPLITLTDGPIELWGGRGRGEEEGKSYRENLKAYKKALKKLHKLGAGTAGYVDKPRADLVVRLLEVAATPSDQVDNLRNLRPFRGVTDADLFRERLGPGGRSAVFALQFNSAKDYADELALHFFYLNVGQANKPWLARVEVPAWVAEDAQMLNDLHAILVDQCRMMGAQAYPYLLHRAHEVALVSREEKEQITEMLLQELRRQKVDFGAQSHKQAAKELPGKRRFTLGRTRY